jgi:pectate lyase
LVGLSDHAKLVVQNNFAEHPPTDAPVMFFNTTGTEIVLAGNLFAGTDGSQHQTGIAFDPSQYYGYTLQTAEQAKASVMAYAGVR